MQRYTNYVVASLFVVGIVLLTSIPEQTHNSLHSTLPYQLPVAHAASYTDICDMSIMQTTYLSLASLWWQQPVLDPLLPYHALTPTHVPSFIRNNTGDIEDTGEIRMVDVYAPTVPTPEPDRPAPLFVAWYAPDSQSAGDVTIPADAHYEVVARYRSDWLQLAVADYGLLWAHTTDVLSATTCITDINALPNLAPIAGYRLHVVQPNEDLAAIAAYGGSTPQLIANYNRIGNNAAPLGRPLIVPWQEGNTSNFALTPYIISRGVTHQPWVALTIDLETGSDTVYYLLDVLRERNTRITFFVLGWWVAAHPDIVQQIVADGHELASHSLSHADFRTLSNAGIAYELAETERLVQQAAPGATTRPFFRPPYGAYDNRVLMAVIGEGYIPVFWTLDSCDAVGEGKSSAYVADMITHIAPERAPGLITLSHCCGGKRHPIAAALPAILDRYAAMGIEVHPLGDVLGQ